MRTLTFVMLLPLAPGAPSPPAPPTVAPPTVAPTTMAPTTAASTTVAPPTAASTSVASPPPLVMASTLPPALVGTWDLDVARSDDPGPLLQRLGVPWLFRVLAPRVVQREIIVQPSRVRIRVSGRPRDEVLTVDGKTPSYTELVGSPLVLVSRVEGDAIVSEGTVTIDGRPLAVKSVRQATTSEMRVTNTFGSGPDALVFRRVFVRAAGSDVAPPTSRL
ncbi:MAG: hypothetical protein FJ137_08030 [Deltaproteobacteria bacterium]|nr:hypothetical protein [Deltaproteobacteria bacterium]